jgi:hypothetical protein
MKVETMYYTLESGWSNASFPDMDSDNTLILLFCAPTYINNPKPIEQFATLYPKSTIIGCSGAGEIIGSNVFDNSISAAIICFEKTKIKVIKQAIETADDSFKTGESLSKQLNKDSLRGIFVLSEGLNINGSELVKGLAAGIHNNKNIVITGGLAGDGSRFKQTWVISQDKIYTNTIVALGLYGEHIQIGHAARGGWDIFGPERYITRSKNNILYELNEQPALELYKKYLGDRAFELPASGLLFPLAIRKNSNDHNSVVRTILAIDEKEQSLIFAGDVPRGYLAQLMRANFDRLIVSASEAGSSAINSILSSGKANQSPVISIAISCVGRKLILGERTEEETEAVLDSLPPGSKQVGFYSYGEISPYIDGACDLHNETMTLTILYEI